MAPRINSRYERCLGVEDDSGSLVLTDREPFSFDPNLPNTIQHFVGEGEDLWSIAYRYFQPIQNAEHLWWIIADFQPNPIQDPTIDLETGRMLYIPSIDVVKQRIFGG